MDDLIEREATNICSRIINEVLLSTNSQEEVMNETIEEDIQMKQGAMLMQESLVEKKIESPKENAQTKHLDVENIQMHNEEKAFSVIDSKTDSQHIQMQNNNERMQDEKNDTQEEDGKELLETENESSQNLHEDNQEQNENKEAQEEEKILQNEPAIPDKCNMKKDEQGIKYKHQSNQSDQDDKITTEPGDKDASKVANKMTVSNGHTNVHEDTKDTNGNAVDDDGCLSDSALEKLDELLDSAQEELSDDQARDRKSCKHM